MSAHKKQVGGDHYKRMAINPVITSSRISLDGTKEILSSILLGIVLREEDRI